MTAVAGDPKHIDPTTIRSVIATDCGSTTTKAILIEKNAKGEYRYYSCGRRMAKRAGECCNRATVREDKLLARIQTAMAAVFDDMDGVLDEVMAISREALELNRSESARLKGEIAETDKMLAGLSRLLVDPEIEAGAKKAIARQLSEHETKRDQLRQALEAVVVQSVSDMDDLMADCRQAFLEAKAKFASLMSPSQFNRFVADVIGPMAVLPDGHIAQKEAVLTAEAIRTAGIAGAGFEPATSAS